MFTKVSELAVRCLTWDDSGLYACADQFIDGYNVGVSVDDGATFAPLSQQDSPCGPPDSCGAGTSIGDECPGRWPAESAELGAPISCDGESGGAGASSGSAGCRIEPLDNDGDRPGAGWIATLAGLGLLLRRRR